jgi:hypothetical protein
MAHWNRRPHDYRGPEYDDRFGRYEGAYARRAALDAWLRERPHRHRGAPPPPWSDRGARRPEVEDELEYRSEFGYGGDYMMRDRNYSRRYWPRSMRGNHRYD